uniref:Neural cell adhesion molecule L1 n=1 Tax=Cyprinus carpio TaxID=7962 RepID=A0A8C1PVI3_CYPCA
MDRLRDGPLALLLFLGHVITALEVPLDLPQPPTITHQSPKDFIIDPRENIVIHCEAKGKPHPSFSWTRNGTHLDIDKDPKVLMKPRSGTLVLDISGGQRAEEYEGVYQCSAHNELGTAVSNSIILRQSRSPLWSKERISPIIAQKGQSLILRCRPPAGLPPPIIFWMDNNFQRLPQSRRVSQALNGDLFFSNILPEDSRSDYICYARFPHTQTIQQKQPISVRVLDMDSLNDTLADYFNHTDLFSDNPVDEREPVFMVPSESVSSAVVLRGEILEMECIADGLPTPAISWVKHNSEIPSGRASFLNFSKTLRITDVSEADAGEYRCIANNHHGSVHHTIRVTVNAAPYWISAPRNLVLAPGEMGIITCRAAGRPKPSIRWLMNGLPIESQDPSRSVEGDTLIFSEVQTGSSAVYQCNASNEYGYLLSNAFVNVLAEPPRVLTLPNTVYQVIMNKPALLECVTFGSPAPTITWFKDSMLEGNAYVFHENGTLEIHMSHPSNSGKYTCVARNSLSLSENHVYLQVKEPTRILRPPEYRVVQRNRDVVFECKAKHDPSLVPTMTWLKDDGELPDDERFRVDSDSLTITDVTESDAGRYTCIMNTTLDQDSASAQLTVVEQPGAPTDLELTDLVARSVQLTWTPGEEHNSRIKKFLIQYEDALHQSGVWHNLTEVPGTKTTAHLKLSPYVHYSFRVLALNNVGFSRPSMPSRQYRTSPAAPDENPTEVKGHGTEHNNLVITWKPLTPQQANGPGLEYKVMWRQQGIETYWTSVSVANVSKFVVSGTPTFVPYEVMVQALNDYGPGPKPGAVIGYSGEDFPSAAPGDVRVLVLNSTLAEVRWSPVPLESVRGRLQGYKVHYHCERSLHRHSSHYNKQSTEIFSPNKTSGKLPDLLPYSIYSLRVTAFNGRGEGPTSATQRFETPEGVPSAPSFFKVSTFDLDSLMLEWGPPYERNGRLTGYTFKYQTGEETCPFTLGTLTALPANKRDPRLYTLTSRHCDGLMMSLCLSVLPVAPAFGNVSSSMSKDGELISWQYWGPEKLLYVEYIIDKSKNPAYWHKEKVNGSQFHVLKGLKKGLAYKVRVVARGHDDRAVHHSEELLVKVSAMVSPQVDIATQGWFIGLMSAIALLILILLIICFIKRNKGGKYPVKEKEDAHGDPEIQPMKEDDITFGEYSDEDHKPLKGSRTPSGGTDKRDGSDDSLVDCGDSGDTEFSEDGSFIGQYSGKSDRDTTHDSSELLSPVNAMNSFV